MKQLIIIGALLTTFSTAHAQTSAGMTHNHWEENDTHHARNTTPVNEFVNMEMTADGASVSFSGIPQVKRAVYAVLTNGEGDFIKQMKISAEQNIMDIKRLHGGLYFVTIVYRNQSKKAFTLNL